MDGFSPSIPYEELTFKARLRASILWLMSKAFRNDIPLELLDPFDEVSDVDYQFKAIIITSLANSEYYAACLTNIYSETQYSGYTHSNVVRVLVEKRIFREDIDLNCFSEYLLGQTRPFALESHMSIIEGLMSLYVFEVLNPNHVATVCDSFIPVHNDELPEDAEEAAIFWLNKSCLRKKQEIMLKYRHDQYNQEFQSNQFHDTNLEQEIDTINDLLPVVPLEDISDISDGCALATLLSLYCPNDFSWQEISFDSQDTSKDSVYNLNRIQHFCRSLLPYNICFLTTEDLLYVDTSIRTNIFAFIADLWYEFVIKPCDLVIEPCRIIQNELLHEMIETVRISNMNQVPLAISPSTSQNNSLDSKVTNTDVPADASSKHDDNGIVYHAEQSYQQLFERQLEKKHAEAFEIFDVNNQPPIKAPPKKLSKTKSTTINRNNFSNKLIPDIKSGCESGASKNPTNGSMLQEKQKLPQTFSIDSETKTEGEEESGKKEIKKKDAIMLLSSKRKAELEAKKASKETELTRLKEEAEKKREQQEQRRLENKKRRELILEQYRQKKKAAEAEKEGPQNEKSQTIPVQSMTNVNQNNKTSTQHMSIRSEYNGPKLFVKPTSKTNLNIVQNAILKALEGAPNAKTLKRVQDTINSHSQNCRHFLILFRDSQQFRGLYDYDDKHQTITKLDGIGPKIVNNEDIIKYYKFDSPKRMFTQVQTKNISLTIIAFSINDNLWLKKRTEKPA